MKISFQVNMVEKMKVISELIPRSWAEVASSSMAALENPPVAVALTSSSSSSLKSPISTSMGSPETSCSLFQTDLSKILLQPESAFKKYAKLAAPAPEDRGRRQISMVKKWIMFYRNLNSMGITRQLATASGRPASAQLLHMISERRRRQKLNDSFQALRSLLPPPTKVLSLCFFFPFNPNFIFSIKKKKKKIIFLFNFTILIFLYIHL